MKNDMHEIRWMYNDGGSPCSEGGLDAVQASKLFKILSRAFGLQISKLEWVKDNRVLKSLGSNEQARVHPPPEYTGEW
jgi:hypothetical protein